MSQFYPPAQKRKKARNSNQSTSGTGKSPASTTSLPTIPSACEVANYVRFVLISGAALELDSNTIEEVTETWADKCCKAVTGCKADGTKVAIPIERVDYMEEV